MLSQQSTDQDREAMIREHYASVYRFMLTLARNADDAADLTQQTFLRACKGIDQFRERSSLRTWVHSIAYREFVRWRRKRVWLPIARAQDQTVDPFQSSLDARDLANALARLPAKQRETFVLAEVQELSVEEVAEIQNIPTGTVKSRLHHAKMRLRTLLDTGNGETYETGNLRRTLEPGCAVAAPDPTTD